MIQIIVKKVPELLDADRCTLFLVDRENNSLVVNKGASQGRQKSLVSWIFGQSNAPELPFEEGKNYIRIPLDRGQFALVSLNFIPHCMLPVRLNTEQVWLGTWRHRVRS